MDRNIVYAGSIPQDTDILTPQQNAMIDVGWLIQSIFGTATGVTGLACTPTSPASMVVNVGCGAIWSQQEIEASTFGSLPADTSPLMKLGINKEAAGTNFTITAPATSGQSIDYLIEAAFLEADGTPVVLPYVNAANPSQAYSGPSNSGTAQNTVRAQTVQLQLKAGAAAATGTQVPPSVDSGWTGLYVITVNYGQTTVISGDIAVYPGAPFVAFNVPTMSAMWDDVDANGSSNSASSGTSLATSITFTPKRNCIIKVDGSAASGAGITNLALSGTGFTVKSQNPLFFNASGPSAGMYTGVLTGTAGIPITITLTVTSPENTGEIGVGFSYSRLPTS